MASRKKKTSYSQQLAGVATMGLPDPVRKVATSKLGSKVLLILIPLLIASGVITVSFSGGMPTINVNKDRATAVGRDLQVEAYKAAQQVKQYGDSSYR